MDAQEVLSHVSELVDCGAGHCSRQGDQNGHPVLLGFLSLAIIGTGFLLLRRLNLGPLSRVGAMLVMGGALSNMVDRFLNGYVVDMIEFLFVQFPIFNVADTAITVGVGLLILSLLFKPEEWGNRHGAS